MGKMYASGSATNAGIDYQQRVAACFQILLYTDFKLSHLLNHDFNFNIKSIHFETTDPIDDLKLICENDNLVFLQIKRSLNFSVLENSEFVKVITQFVKQFAIENGYRQKYLLVSSSDCSTTISSELNKILSSIKLNDVSFDLNPINKSEKEVYSKFRALFFDLYKKNSGKKADEHTFIEFSKRVYFAALDIESERPLEKSLLMLLSGIFNTPELIWSLLIKNSLQYASDRASINQHTLKSILDTYKIEKGTTDTKSAGHDELAPIVSMKGEYSCGKEIVILESFHEKADYIIMELFRFSDTCTKKYKFFSNKVTLPKLGMDLTVIFRGATLTGMMRFIEQNQDIFKDKRVVHLPSSQENVEESECSKIYATYLERLQAENSNPLICLHCNKPVSQDNNILIEIDDDYSKSAVGSIHSECRRPIDRVLGYLQIVGDKKPKFLEYFDSKQWVELAIKGQGLMNGLRESPDLANNSVIAWSSSYSHNTDVNYCVKFFMEDGTINFAFERGKIHRITKREAEKWATETNAKIEEQKKLNNPLCFTAIHKAYGQYNMLLKTKAINDTIVEIKKAEAIRYSFAEAQLYEKGIMYYAPLCILIGRDEGEIFNLGNVIPIISNPLEIEHFIESWKKAGVNVEEIELKIIKSDDEFDTYMRSFFSDEMQPIIDPIFDTNRNLVKGIVVQHYEKIIASKESEGDNNAGEEKPLFPVENPQWKKDDIARAILPGDKNPEPMIGRLLYDELANEKEERYVVFRPIENNKEVEDVNLVIPSKYIHNISSNEN